MFDQYIAGSDDRVSLVTIILGVLLAICLIVIILLVIRAVFCARKRTYCLWCLRAFETYKAISQSQVRKSSCPSYECSFLFFCSQTCRQYPKQQGHAGWV